MGKRTKINGNRWTVLIKFRRKNVKEGRDKWDTDRETEKYEGWKKGRKEKRWIEWMK